MRIILVICCSTILFTCTLALDDTGRPAGPVVGGTQEGDVVKEPAAKAALHRQAEEGQDEEDGELRHDAASTRTDSTLGSDEETRSGTYGRSFV